MTVAVRFVSQEEFQQIERERLAAHERWKEANPDIGDEWPAERQAINDRAYPPGLMWECPWFHDPEDRRERKLAKRMRKRSDADWEANPNHYLSRHYWLDWALIRPPLCVICPNGDQWVVDAKANNGPGWTVKGEPPLITCAPSIKTTGYHGYLRKGRFTADLDREKAPNGVRRDGSPA